MSEYVSDRMPGRTPDRMPDSVVKDMFKKICHELYGLKYICCVCHFKCQLNDD